MKADNLAYLMPSWFDLLTVALLLVGFFRGRKRGMSEELLPVLQWLMIVVLGAHFYQPVGKLLSQASGMGLLMCYLTVYLGNALLIKVLFVIFRRFVGEKLVGSDLFGRMEYYFGIVAGGLRYMCMLLAFLAVLNARLYTDAERKAIAKVQQDNFGSINFPTLDSIQTEVFKNSFTGRQVLHYLSDPSGFPMLIKPTPPEDTFTKQRERGIGKRRERDLNELMK